jgi:hypothetical protein
MNRQFPSMKSVAGNNNISRYGSPAFPMAGAPPMPGYLPHGTMNPSDFKREAASPDLFYEQNSMSFAANK